MTDKPTTHDDPRRRRITPTATYRLQLRAEFDLDDAAALIDYLAALGVSHVYTSPLLQAAPGSTHGYDVVDHERVSRELGGGEALQRFGARLAAHGLGHVADLVPNHMAIGRENAWWWDVLENGAASPFASCFDVDWNPPEARLRNRVLLPILADHYGRVLEAGELQVVRQGVDFAVRYREHELPISPASLAALLRGASARCACAELAQLAEAFACPPPTTSADAEGRVRRHRQQDRLRERLARLLASHDAAASAVAAQLVAINADPDALDALVERQNWRVARWRSGQRDLGYRRFADLDHLVGLRVEDSRVFDAIHGPLLSWRAGALIQGVRVDHVDGLREPARYLKRLRAVLPEAWIVVEKVLSPGEALPEDWPVDGTTGYDFLNLAGGLFVDPAGEEPLGALYAAFTGETRDFDAIAREKKDRMLRQALAADLGRLTALTLAVCEGQRRYRDFTRHELHEGLCASLACLPVYRTYQRAGVRSTCQADDRAIRTALASARRSRVDLDPDVFDFLEALLLRQFAGRTEDEVALRFQQLSAASQAKGVEDTAFYTYHRLVSLNEVGGDPGRFGTRPVEFHATCRRIQERRPGTLLATSTHDTKRSEDVRARLQLLSEIPARFGEALRLWSACNERHRCGDLPDRNTEYLFYQTLVGTWPIETERVLSYMEKAAREAKEHTCWTDPEPRYEAALRAFVRGALGDAGFLRALEAFVAPLVTPGRINSLAQTLLKLTAPGVPDLYQGCELWEASLVDPDNRRPVDWSRRRVLLAALQELEPVAIWKRADQGLPKLWLIQQALRLRRRHPDWFGAAGGYEPLAAIGPARRHAVAFARAGSAIAVAPRLVLGLAAAGGFGDTFLELPPGTWRNLLSGRAHASGPVGLLELLSEFPVALLERVAP